MGRAHSAFNLAYTSSMKIKETKVYKYRWPIGVLILLAVIGWFIWRDKKKENAHKQVLEALVVKQRKEHEREKEITDSIQRRKEDSIIMYYLGIGTKVEYKIIEREKYVIRFIDTASIATKFRYVDSLLGK